MTWSPNAALRQERDGSEGSVRERPAERESLKPRVAEEDREAAWRGEGRGRPRDWHSWRGMARRPMPEP